MGEHAQPVLGMKSCHEYSDEDRGETNWYALEGFVARKAEVQVSEDIAVLPNVKMDCDPRGVFGGAVHQLPLDTKDHPDPEGYHLATSHRSSIYYSTRASPSL